MNDSITKLLQYIQQKKMFQPDRWKSVPRDKDLALFVCQRKQPGENTRIALSQLQLFIDERRYIEKEFNLVPVFSFSDEIDRIPDEMLARCVFIGLQSNFDETAETFSRRVDRFRRLRSDVRLVYFDYTAPTDLRLAPVVHDHVSLFVKKHVLKDRSQYRLTTLGDTNLSDYYNRKYGIEEVERQFTIPDGFFDKLVVGPTFYTDYRLRRQFEQGKPETNWDRKTIDVHARFAEKGTPWYQAMRRESGAAISAISGEISVAYGMVSKAQYARELKLSKSTFSPFGYGEICWRDFEAFSTGAVLLKPDVSHVELAIDSFRPGETYQAVSWSYDNLSEQVADILGDPDKAIEMSGRAFQHLHDYFDSRAFEPFLAKVLCS